MKWQHFPKNHDIINPSTKRVGKNDARRREVAGMASTVITTVETTVTVQSPVKSLTGQAGKDAVKAFAAFTALKAAQKVLDDQKAAAEATLREILGDAEKVTVEGEDIFKLAHRTNSSIDREVLQNVFPEAFEATLKKTPYTFITAC